MPFVVGVLKAADYRCCGPEFFRELALAQPRFGTQIINLARDIGIDDLLFVLLNEFRVVPDITVIRVLQGG